MKKTYEEDLILEIIDNSESKVSPLNLIKQIVKKTGIPLTSAKKTIKRLTEQKKFEYTNFFGSTYIELSYNKPVKITNHFVLIPVGLKALPRKNEIDIFITPGVSFGSGRHPTTRLSLKAIDHIVSLKKFQKLQAYNHNRTGLDIGTGSGVLAIAVCKTLVSHCLALDIDPNSIAEAKKNVIANKLRNQIKIFDTDIKMLNQKFSHIIANLRYPTLINLLEKITSLSQKNTVLILSGIRPYEKDGLKTIYAANGFELIWEMDEKNWSCIAMQFKDNQ